jgi:hypothetical protein
MSLAGPKTVLSHRPVDISMVTAILENVADDLESMTAVVSQKAPNIFQENGLRLMLPYDLLDPEKERPARILESKLTTSLGERLTREASAKNVELRDLLDRELGDISGKELISVSKDRPILPFVKVVLVSTTGSSVPFAGKDALGTLCVVECHMEAANACKEVNEVVFILLGLSGHRLCKTTKVFCGPSKSK